MSVWSQQQDEFLRRPEFDLVSWRSWRRETLFRYSTANQSEPLRLVIFLLLTIGLLLSGPLAEAVGAPAPEPPLAYAGGAVAAFGLFARERDARTRKLLRLERESVVADLRVVQRRNVAVGGGVEQTLKSLRGERRVLAVYAADAATLRDFETAEILPLRRRLEAAKVDVVCVSQRDASFARRGTSFVEPARLHEWRSVFAELLTKKDDDATPTDRAYFALAFDGRSCASGAAKMPSLLEVAGANFPPLSLQGAGPLLRDAPGLPEQARFYDALTAGDLAAMADLFGADDDPDVSAAKDAGGRLDAWAAQLRDGARPADLLVRDADVFLADDGLSATTTAIESSSADPTKTLLALQRWTKNGDSWRLLSHATVPFAPNTAAGALLRCDHRGCVLLVNARQ